MLSDFKIEGKENLPVSGPLLVIGNRFSFIDPVAVLRTLPYLIEFVGGAVFPHAPKIVRSIPQLWGYYPVVRGTGSRFALRAAEEIIKQDGVLGIMPEGGSLAEVLRPARPGATFLAAQTGAKVLPLGIFGFNDIFPIKLGNRPKVVVRIGKPVGPFTAPGRGRERREQLDKIGLELMKSITDLLPDRYRGFLADDPAMRAAARGTEDYPWENLVEGQVEGEVH